MGIWQRLFGREFDKIHYETGHGRCHKAGNIIVYIIASAGSMLLLAVPSFLVYSTLQGELDRSFLWVSIPIWLVAIGLIVLMWYGVQKSQMPED